MLLATRHDDGFDQWEDQICHTFLPLRAKRDRPALGFTGKLHATNLGSVLLADIKASEAMVERTPKLIKSEDPELYKFSLQLSGTSIVEQDERQALLKPGDLAIYDTSRPYRISFSDDFRMIVAMFPKTMTRIPQRQMSSQTAVAMPSKSGTNVYIAHLMSGLASQLQDPDTALDTHLGDAIVDLVTASFAQRIPHGLEVPGSESHRTLVERASTIARQRLGDPELSSQSIADLLFVSVRYLQKAFEAQGTSVSTMIRELRLEQCRRDLTNPHADHVPIAQIASKWGLRDPAHFSRIFRKAYGASPRDFRKNRELG